MRQNSHNRDMFLETNIPMHDRCIGRSSEQQGTGVSVIWPSSLQVAAISHPFLVLSLGRTHYRYIEICNESRILLTQCVSFESFPSGIEFVPNLRTHSTSDKK